MWEGSRWSKQWLGKNCCAMRVKKSLKRLEARILDKDDVNENGRDKMSEKISDLMTTWPDFNVVLHGSLQISLAF